VYPDPLEELLELYSLEELFEVLDIEPLRVLEILYEGGHIDLTNHMDYYYDIRGREAEA
jgi:hypothetical protein